MTDDSRIQQLLASDAAPEADCASCPELLPVVHRRSRRTRRLDADLDAVFPPHVAAATLLDGTDLPQIPRHEVEAEEGHDSPPAARIRYSFFPLHIL